MVPDRNIVQKIKSYDSALYVKWNQEDQYFEIWRKMEHGGHRLITPVTRSIYGKAPMEYCDLDERIVFWLYCADSWRYKSSKHYALESDSRFMEFARQAKIKRKMEIRDFSKDMWMSMKSHYPTRYASKNSGKPNFNKVKEKWVRPDIQATHSPRIFYRSHENAKRFNYKG